ncbi:MAG: hypothetical protein U9O41_00975 [Candidatus Aerophobetes bacterium]|nr:hypothetical protein [Candidatus Aerophobetes bacterium]
MQEKKEDKLWKVEISEGENSCQFYLVSSQKPIFILETSFGKFRRMFSLSSRTYPSPQLPPTFYISRRQKAKAEKTQKMYGFNLQKLTPQYILLSLKNPLGKSLYEVSLFNKKVKNFFKKEYILALNKKEAVEQSQKFKFTYRVKVTKAKKMDCYPVLSVTNNKIALKRQIKPG